MRKKILDILNTTARQLAFALISGLGYFMIIFRFILAYTERGGALLAFFFAAAIICGAALIIIKAMKSCREQENESGILKLFYLHIAVIIVGIIFAADIIL
ncbi:MAG: hypothetical protein PUF72_06260 [Clostridiales bacterium]|nr:hypothetical protein [Clostridiales bacterium]